MAQGDSSEKSLVSRLPRHRKKGNKRQIPWLYDLVLWSLSVLIDLFFREVHPRGAWKVPKKGPVILVAAPHANQVGNTALFGMRATDVSSLLIR